MYSMRGKGPKMSETQMEMVGRAAAYIKARQADEADGPVTLDELASHCGLSPWHLQRQFKRAMGVSPREYEESLRLERFKKGLRSGAGVAAATFEAGFGSSSRVYERAGAALGMTPASYAEGGRGAEIRYAVGESHLGLVLVAATPRGICRVELGDDLGDLEGQLRAEFPRARSIARDDSGLGRYLAEILRRIAGQTPRRDLPLDIRMTAFQRKVWSTLSRIPTGETLSYGAIARVIGQPGAAQAVGQACGANPVAIAIPCHRALRNDGAIGGYAWGSQRKQALISAEAAALTSEGRGRSKKTVSG
ncbi:AraC family transcriptional regulator of adaptative response/methylated-DNA-[protein]-cysteine methyltransferase [Dongia mobilis]|uniref:methylated-DNA--[protein]-cysteine S-methyltransferase n=2 Tax=Dongia mobilis TaxID=578943 RepID=A0A4R6WTM8_9PROT|nr:AraC family transcriptional regulator of adaptative response/methylated-DNA-[protein]-cysteine methyltransferase [Dongia mobilis]